MKVHYRYEPEVARFWIGATEGELYQEYALQHWMSVEDVISILQRSEEQIKERQHD